MQDDFDADMTRIQPRVEPDRPAGQAPVSGGTWGTAAGSQPASGNTGQPVPNPQPPAQGTWQQAAPQAPVQPQQGYAAGAAEALGDAGGSSWTSQQAASGVTPGAPTWPGQAGSSGATWTGQGAQSGMPGDAAWTGQGQPSGSAAQYAGGPQPQGAQFGTAVPTIEHKSLGGTPFVEGFKSAQLWVAAAKTAGIGYAIAVLLSLIGAAALGASMRKAITGLGSTACSAIGVSGMCSSLDSFGDKALPTSRVLQLLFQLPAMAFGGRFTVHASAEGQSASLGIGIMPLLITLLVLVGVVVATRRFTRTADFSRTQITAFAVATGVIFATVLELLAWIFTMHVNADEAKISIGAAGIGSWFLSLLLVGVAAWASAGRKLAVPASWRAHLWAVLVHLGGATAVMLVIALVKVLFSDRYNPGFSGTIAALVLVAGTALAWVLNLGLLGRLSASGMGQNESVALLGSAHPIHGSLRWLILLTVLLAVVSALVMYLRGGAGRPVAIAKSAAIWGVLGLALQLLSGVHASTSGLGSSIGDKSGGMGMQGSSFLIWALWGAAIGALAVFGAPRVAGYLPPAMVAWVQKGVASQAAPQAAPAQQQPAQGFGGQGQQQGFGGQYSAPDAGRPAQGDAALPPSFPGEGSHAWRGDEPWNPQG